MKNKGLRVGITCGVENGHRANPFLNGAYQNLVFVYCLLRESSHLARVEFLNQANDPAPQMEPLSGFKIPLRTVYDAKDDIDVLIIMGILLPDDFVFYLRRRGCKIIYYNVGNQYFYTLESLIFHRGVGLGALAHRGFDAIWMIPGHEASRALFEVYCSSNIYLAPYVWNSMFVDDKINETQASYGYRPPERARRIACLEPNLNVVKSFFIPTMIMELFYRQHPELVRGISINNLHQLNRAELQRFLDPLSMMQSGKVALNNRIDTVTFMAEYGDVVVSHQFENQANYLMFDLLYGNYPVVHNSLYFKEIGFYYEGFDANMGAKELYQAATVYDEQLEVQKIKNREMIKRHDVYNPQNINGYEQLIDQVFENKEV